MASEKNNLDPSIFIICGATGDLVRRKLLLALFRLFIRNELPNKFALVAFSRREWVDEEYRAFARDILLKLVTEEEKKYVSKFLNAIYYHRGHFDDQKSFARLQDLLLRIDRIFEVCANKLFYLATPPNYYMSIIENMDVIGLNLPCGGDKGWARILIEKPFGRDIDSARKLDKQLKKSFQEEQIFIIDHYLAKETIQNILAFRFSNHFLEPIWNKDAIEKIHIKMLEKDDIAGRGALYDDLGALRDVGQNHLLQMLALIAMDEPEGLKGEVLRIARAQVLSKLKRSEKKLKENVVRAQYRGYQNEQNIKLNSTTETYFRVTCEINNKRWSGVPFILESGKALSESRVSIKVYFKGKICRCYEVDHRVHQNTLEFRIQPNEGVALELWTKKPGLRFEVMPRILSFMYTAPEETSFDAYEKVLYDCFFGDQTLFQSTDEIEAAWKFITPILKCWHTLPLYQYEKGASITDQLTEYVN